MTNSIDTINCGTDLNTKFYINDENSFLKSNKWNFESAIIGFYTADGKEENKFEGGESLSGPFFESHLDSIKSDSMNIFLSSEYLKSVLPIDTKFIVLTGELKFKNSLSNKDTIFHLFKDYYYSCK